MTMPLQKPGRSKQDYGTPLALIRAVEKRFGPLVLDLAAHDDGRNAKCPVWIGESENALVHPWAEYLAELDGIGWLNPEFADIGPWVEKCGDEAAKGARIIALTPASVGAEWYAAHVEFQAAVIPLRPRICFQGCHVLGKNGLPKCGGDTTCDGCATYPKDCMLTLWGFESENALSHGYFKPSWRWDEEKRAA